MTSHTVTIKLQVDGEGNIKKAFQDLDQEADKMGSTLKNVGAIAGGFLAAGAVEKGLSAVTGFMKDSIEAASSLGESINAVNVTFGESAAVLHEFGKTSAEEVGLSARAFNELATPIGAILKNAKVPLEQTAGLTVDLTKRAADMASVFNTDVDQALQAISSGLRGEANPLERFGVGLSAANVEARALAETGKTSAKALTEQEKALARVNLIMEQTNNLSGDFKNTSDGLANSQRIQAAKTEELQAAIGNKLIPIQLKLNQIKFEFVKLLAGSVLPAMEAFGKVISTVAGFLSEHKEVLAGLAAVMLTLFLPALIAIVAATWLWVAALIAAAIAFIAANAPIIAIALVIGVLVAAIVLAIKHWDEIVEAVPILGVVFDAVSKAISTAIEAIKSAVGALVEYIKAHWDDIKAVTSAVWAFIQNDIMTRVEGIKQYIQGLIQVITGMIDLVVALIHGDWAGAWEAAKQIVSGALDMIQGYFKTMFGSLPGIILGFAGEAANAALSLATDVVNSIGNKLGELPGAVKNVMNDAIAMINRFINSLSGRTLIPGIDAGILGSTPSVKVPSLPNIPSLDVGTPFVPRDMLALLHRGEAVIPASMNNSNDMGSGGLTINIGTVNARSGQEVRGLASRLGWSTIQALEFRNYRVS